MRPSSLDWLLFEKQTKIETTTFLVLEGNPTGVTKTRTGLGLDWDWTIHETLLSWRHRDIGVVAIETMVLWLFVHIFNHIEQYIQIIDV